MPVDEIRCLLRAKKAVFLDLDGVVYAGDALIPGADRAVEWLRGANILLRFLSNNSLKHPRSIASKLERLGIPCPVEHVLTSGMLACRALRSLLGEHANIAVIGTEELKTLAIEAGLLPTDDENAPAVLVGMNPEFRYEHIILASRAIRSGAAFFACNRDGMFMGSGGQYFPGCGAMVGAIEGATGIAPKRCFGKPDAGMLEEALMSGGWDASDCLMIGDTWSSDIAMAQSVGMDWIYVGSEKNVACPDGRRLASIGMISVSPGSETR